MTEQSRPRVGIGEFARPRSAGGSRAASKPRFRILMTADLGLLPVPPPRYGGAERAVETFSRALCARGHTIDLIAKAGSTRFNGELYTPPGPSAAYWSRAACKILYQPVSLWAARRADVVHCHSRFDYLFSLLKTSKPLVIHFHNEVKQDHVALASQPPSPEYAPCGL